MSFIPRLNEPTTDKHAHSLGISRLLTAFVGVGASLLISSNAKAAESVTLQYNDDSVTVTMPEMQNFAKTGQLTPALQTFFDTTQSVPTEWSKLLTQEIKIPYFIERLIHSPKGRYVLHQFDEMVYSTGSEGLVNLDQAVTQAMADGTISVAEVIQDYPAPTINIDLKVVETDYQQIKQLAEGIETGDTKMPPPDFLKGLLCHCKSAKNIQSLQTPKLEAKSEISEPNSLKASACIHPLVQN